MVPKPRRIAARSSPGRPAQHGGQRLRRGAREVPQHLLIDSRPGFLRFHGVGGGDVGIAPQGLRCGVDGDGPAIGLPPLVEALPEVPDQQIPLHLQVGDRPLEVLLAALAESGLPLQLEGEPLLLRRELVHDPLLAHGGKPLVPAAVEVVAVPPPVGKVGEPLPGDEAGPLPEELAVGHPPAPGHETPPLPGVPLYIAGPPEAAGGVLLHGEAVHLVFEQGQKADLIDPVRQLLPALDAAGGLPVRAPHNPDAAFHGHCHPSRLKICRAIRSRPCPDAAGKGVKAARPLSAAEVGADLRHAPRLLHMEGAAAVAVAALDAVLRMAAQVAVVVPRQLVAGPGQVVILVDQAYVQPGGAGLAVVAVDADAGGVPGGEGAQHGVVPLLRGGVQESQDPREVRPVPDAGQHREHPGLVQGVLEALVFREGLPEGRGLGVEQLAAAEGLHHGDAHALRLAPAVEGHPLLRAADGVVPVVVVIAGVDAEHQKIQDPHVQDPVHHLGRVRAHADVPNGPLPLELLDIVQNAAVQHRLEIGFLVQAVEEAEVDIVGFQGAQLPVDGALDGVQIRGPAVHPALVVGAEVDLEADLVPRSGHGPAIGGERRRVRRGHVKKVDPLFQRQFHSGLDLILSGGADGAGAQPQNADLLLSVGEFSIFHRISSSIIRLCSAFPAAYGTIVSAADENVKCPGWMTCHADLT